jgi:hypothetical protein
MEKATRKQILQMKATLDKTRSHLKEFEVWSLEFEVDGSAIAD